VGTKSDFTADEWKMILTSPMLAGMAVTLAEPSGLFGILKEGMASGRALLEAKSGPGANALIKELVADMETSEGRTTARDAIKAELTGKSPDEMKSQVLSVLSQVARTLDAKAPQDSAAFKSWLKHVAEQVAEASSEGGFLGFGGVKVSDAEKASIADLAKALNLV
jgi:hypothetical protein